MARGLNTVFLIGFVGQDPESKTIPNGTEVCNFSVGTGDRKKVNGEWAEKTEWHNVVAWSKMAEICGKYLRKGSRVHIEGHLETRSYEREGQKHYRTTVVLERLLKLDGKRTEGEAAVAVPDSDDDADLPF